MHKELRHRVHDHECSIEDPEKPGSGVDQNISLAESRRIASEFFMFASLAGICGAMSSVAGKMAVMTDFIPHAIDNTATYFGFHVRKNEEGILMSVLATLPLLVRLVLFCSNLVFTTQMWRFYIKSLALGPVPVAQIVNTGVNFGVSALMGFLFFHEEITLLWASGAILVIIGLAIVVDGQSRK